MGGTIEAKQKKYGFTIIELVVVAMVVGILATIGFVSYGAVTERARINETKTFAFKMARALDDYAARVGFYPSTLEVDSASWLQANLYPQPTSIDDFINNPDRDAGTLPAGQVSLVDMPYNYNPASYTTGYNATTYPALRYKVLYIPFRFYNNTFYNNPSNSTSNYPDSKAVGYMLAYLEVGGATRAIIRAGKTP